MKYIVILLLLGGILGAGLMLWLGIKSSQKSSQDNQGDINDD